MRRQWACPDLGTIKDDGLYMPIPGSPEEFPDCPAGYLRTRFDVDVMRDRLSRDPFAEHLIDGRVHPASIVSQAATEIENGARAVDTVSPKVLSLVHVWFREKAAREDFASDLRRKKHG